MIKLLAHRCGPATGAENTIEAMETAVGLGADGIECDVQLTKDGEPVIFHDDDLMRMAGSALKIADTPYKELAGVRVQGRYRIPHLKDVLDFVKSHSHLDFYFDFHNPSFKLAETTAKTIEKAGLFTQCFILGFYTESKDFLLWARSVAPLVRIALMPELPWGIVERAQKVGAQKVALGWDRGALTRYLFQGVATITNLKSEISRVKAAAIEVAGGISNTPSQVRWFLKNGVTGIWSDDIRMARQTIEAYHG